MKLIVFAFFIMLFLAFIEANAQTSVIVNADGAHSIAIHNGSSVTVVNPNGTHSVGTITGNVITVANSDGSFGTGFYNASSNTPNAKSKKISVEDDSFYSNHPLNWTILKYRYKLRKSCFSKKRNIKSSNFLNSAQYSTLPNASRESSDR